MDIRPRCVASACASVFVLNLADPRRAVASLCFLSFLLYNYDAINAEIVVALLNVSVCSTVARVISAKPCFAQKRRWHTRYCLRGNILQQAHAKQQQRQILAREEQGQAGGNRSPRGAGGGLAVDTADVAAQAMALSLTDEEGAIYTRPRQVWWQTPDKTRFIAFAARTACDLWCSLF